MSQHDMDIANQSGALFRADLNNALLALATHQSGNSAPTTTYAFQYWIDTSGANPILKQRNAANNAWIVIGRADLEAYGLNGIVSGTTEPSAPLAFQYWVDTSGANPILKIRNAANTAWVTVGRVDVANYGLLPLTGGTMSGGILFSNTDSTSIPVGTTAQRPGSPAVGMIRFNSSLTTFEGYNGTAWAPIGGGGYTATTVETISPGGTISSSTTDTRQLRTVQGNAAAVNASATPFGTGGGWKDATEITVVCISDANSVTFTASDVAKGVLMDYSSIELTKGKKLTFIYSSELDRWIA